MATTYYAAIQQLYVAYFNRPADVAGLQYWETVVENNKGSTAAVAAAFAASTEYKSAYANMSAYQIVNTVYNNLFGHDADVAGLNFWAQNMIAGKFTVDQAVTAIAAGAQGTDQTTFNNRVTAATSFTGALTTTQQIIDYTGAAANTAAKNFLAGVTDNNSLANAIAPAALAASVNTVTNAYLDSIGTTVALTSGVDTLTGTAGNDYFTATINSTGSTFSAFDSINGGAGTNSLSIVDTTTAGTFTLPSNVTLTNIQNLNVSTSELGANLDASGFASMTSVKLNSTDTTSTNADVVKVNAASAVNVTSAGGSVSVDGGTSVAVSAKGAVTIGGTTAPTGAVTVNTGNAAVTGTNGTAGAISIKGGSTVAVTETLTAPTVTGTTGSAFAETGGAVTVTGTANTTSVSVTQTAAVTGVAGVAAVPAVAQVDTIGIAGTTATGNTYTVTVNGTAYTYTATATDTTSANVATGLAAAINASGIAATASGSTVTLTSSNAGTAFTASTSTSGSGSIGAPVVATANVPAVAAVSAVAGIIGGAVSITDASSANTDGTKANTITTVNLDGYGAGSIIKSNALTSLTLANSSKDVVVNDFTATPTNTTLNVTVNNLASGASLTDSTIKTLNLTTGATASTLAVNAAAATKLSVAGASGLTLNLTGATHLTTIDASASTGTVSFGSTGLSSTVNSVTTGSGNTTVVLNTATLAAVAATSTTAAVAAVNATVTAGAGNDTIDLRGVTGTGNFTVAAGAGNDIIKLNQSQMVAGNTIDGGAGTDTLLLTNNTTAFAAGDYALMNSTITNVENVEFVNAVGGIDASKVGFTSYAFDNTGIITNVGTQTLTTSGTSLTATATGDTAAVVGTSAGTYAGTLNVTATNAASTLTLNADSAIVNVKATAGATGAAGTTIGGDLQTSLTVNLSNAANSATASAITGDVLSTATVLVNGASNTALKSIVLTGAGTVTIDAHASVALTSVDASQLGGTIANGSTKGAITGGLNYTANTAIAETITLGSGHDTITAGSTYGKLDTIVGFDAVKDSSTGASTSDVLVISAAQLGNGASSALTLNGTTPLTGTNTTEPGISKLTLATTDTTLDLAFVHAASASHTTGGVVEFSFGGNTYLFADTNGNGTLDANDFAIKLVGNVDVSGAFGIPASGT